MSELVAANLGAVREPHRGRRARRRPRGRRVTLVAVSKTHPPAAVRAALAAGQRVFGENRVQEAQAKFPGAAQRISRPRLAPDRPAADQQGAGRGGAFRRHRDASTGRASPRRWRARWSGPAAALPCFIEVNTGEEPQKAGVLPGDADAFIAACRDRLGLPIEGLMCIPPEHEEPALHFALLREIARRNGLAELSMGMSADFETAIRFGATHVRVGTAIFGARRPLAAAE